MSPMCQYSAKHDTGFPNEWHNVHYASRAIGGVGLITIEMTAIEKMGRSTLSDLGIWSDDHIPYFKKIIDSSRSYDAKVCIQLSHAGRKAQVGKSPIAPSPIKFNGENYHTPMELSIKEIKRIIYNFTLSAKRAIAAGADTIELHAAHGYLIHQFQSPLTNKRNDIYGELPWQFGVEVIKSVKSEIPFDTPLILRISATEYTEGGYDIEYILRVCEEYKKAGVDIFSISSGGEGQFPSDYPAHHVPFSRRIKENLKLPTIVAGVLDNPQLADSVIRNRDADLIAIGRGLLRNPYWAYLAANELKVDVKHPKPYLKAF